MIDIGLANYVTVWVANAGALSHAHESICLNLLTIQFEFDIDCAAKVLPEARAEAWYRVEIVEAVLEIVLTALVKRRFRDVDVAACVKLSFANIVDNAFRAYAHVVLHVLSVA